MHGFSHHPFDNHVVPLLLDKFSQTAAAEAAQSTARSAYLVVKSFVSRSEQSAQGRGRGDAVQAYTLNFRTSSKPAFPSACVLALRRTPETLISEAIHKAHLPRLELTYYLTIRRLAFKADVLQRDFKLPIRSSIACQKVSTVWRTLQNAAGPTIRRFDSAGSTVLRSLAGSNANAHQRGQCDLQSHAHDLRKVPTTAE